MKKIFLSFLLFIALAINCSSIVLADETDVDSEQRASVFEEIVLNEAEAAARERAEELITGKSAETDEKKDEEEEKKDEAETKVATEESSAETESIPSKTEETTKEEPAQAKAEEEKPSTEPAEDEISSFEDWISKIFGAAQSTPPVTGQSLFAPVSENAKPTTAQAKGKEVAEIINELANLIEAVKATSKLHLSPIFGQSFKDEINHKLRGTAKFGAKPKKKIEKKESDKKTSDKDAKPTPEELHYEEYAMGGFLAIANDILSIDTYRTVLKSKQFEYLTQKFIDMHTTLTKLQKDVRHLEEQQQYSEDEEAQYLLEVFKPKEERTSLSLSKAYHSKLDSIQNQLKNIIDQKIPALSKELQKIKLDPKALEELAKERKLYETKPVSFDRSSFWGGRSRSDEGKSPLGGQYPYGWYPYGHNYDSYGSKNEPTLPTTETTKSTEPEKGGAGGLPAKKEENKGKEADKDSRSLTELYQAAMGRLYDIIKDVGNLSPIDSYMEKQITENETQITDLEELITTIQRREKDLEEKERKRLAAEKELKEKKLLPSQRSEESSQTTPKAETEKTTKEEDREALAQIRTRFYDRFLRCAPALVKLSKVPFLEFKEHSDGTFRILNEQDPTTNGVHPLLQQKLRSTYSSISTMLPTEHKRRLAQTEKQLEANLKEKLNAAYEQAAQTVIAASSLLLKPEDENARNLFPFERAEEEAAGQINILTIKGQIETLRRIEIAAKNKLLPFDVTLKNKEVATEQAKREALTSIYKFVDDLSSEIIFKGLNSYLDAKRKKGESKEWKEYKLFAIDVARQMKIPIRTDEEDFDAAVLANMFDKLIDTTDAQAARLALIGEDAEDVKAREGVFAKVRIDKKNAKTFCDIAPNRLLARSLNEMDKIKQLLKALNVSKPQTTDDLGFEITDAIVTEGENLVFDAKDPSKINEIKNPAEVRCIKSQLKKAMEKALVNELGNELAPKEFNKDERKLAAQKVAAYDADAAKILKPDAFKETLKSITEDILKGLPGKDMITLTTEKENLLKDGGTNVVIRYKLQTTKGSAPKDQPLLIFWEQAADK